MTKMEQIITACFTFCKLIKIIFKIGQIGTDLKTIVVGVVFCPLNFTTMKRFDKSMKTK